ncbi:MAG: 50S ribosomal protein L4 [Chloroflexota bacterium]
MKLAVRDGQGKELRQLDVDETVFGIEPNIGVLHQAFVSQRANQRAGTASTKTRGQVQGSTRKIRKQKYTGAARAGSIRAPNRVGGGIAFGPKPRSYAKDMPKKMRRLAIRSALSGKLADGQLVVVDSLSMDAPKTKEMIRLFATVGFERSVLVVTGEPDRKVLASVRNMEKTKSLPAAYLNVVDMMSYAGLLMTEDAVRVAEKLWGKKDTRNGIKMAPREKLVIEEKAPAPSRRSRARAEGETAEAKTEEAPSGRKTKFVPKTEVAVEAPEPEAKAPAAEAEAATEEKPARAVRAPKSEPKAEATAEIKTEAPRPAARRKKADDAEGETPAEGEKPKRAPRAKAEKPATEGAAEKPKRAPRAKKTEEGDKDA